MPSEDPPSKSAGFKFTTGLTKFARDAAVSSVVQKGLREISRNKSLRRAGTDLIINYARPKKHEDDRDRDRRRRDYSSGSDSEEDDRRRGKGKGKGKMREMRSGGKGRDYYDDRDRGRRSSYDYDDRPRPSSRSRPSSDSWFEKAFGGAPSWNRGSGFRTNADGPPSSSSRRGGNSLTRSISNPGQSRSSQPEHGYTYSHGGHGYAFRDPAPQSRTSYDGLPPDSSSSSSHQHAASPYDMHYRQQQSGRREDEERQRAFAERQRELGGVAMGAGGVPLYGYRPGEEPDHHRESQGQKGLAGLFGRAAIGPGGDGGGSGSRTPIETRMGTFNTSGSGLYSKVFTRAPEVPASVAAMVSSGAAHSPHVDERDDYHHEGSGGGGDKDLPGIPQTRQSLAPELRSKTHKNYEPEPQPQQHRQQMQARPNLHSPERSYERNVSSPTTVIPHSSASAFSSTFPVPQITHQTTVQTLSFAARCSQIIYHLSTSPAIKHYQKNYDSHPSNPSLLETHLPDPKRGTKNWALLRRKGDGALIVAIRGSGRGLSKGTDYGKDMSWLDDEEWLSDMMLNLKARKWSGGGTAGGGSGLTTRRNSTGGSSGPNTEASSRSSSKSLSLSSIRCADGSRFEAHEGFMKCAMAMYADVGRALDKRLKMWTLLGASSGVSMGLGGRGGPGWEEGGGGVGGKAMGGMEMISPPELIFTGHSAGGAVASLLYVLFDAGHRDLLDRFGKVSVISFGTAAAFPHPSSAPLTHANTHSSRRSNAGRVRDVHLSIIHKDDPIPRMDVLYALSLLETALGGPKNTSAALMALQAMSSQSKNREVGELVKLVREGAERAKEMRKREKEARRMERAAEEVVGGGVPGAEDGRRRGGGEDEMPPKTTPGMTLWPAGDLYLLAPSASSEKKGPPKSILKSGSGSKSTTASTSTSTSTPAGAQMQLYTYTHAHLAKSKPTEWGAHRIAKYFSILEEMEKRVPGLRV